MAVALANPISADMSVMRTSLWAGLLSTAVHNLNRQQSRVRIFEAGQCFVPAGNKDARKRVGSGAKDGSGRLICGSRTPNRLDRTKEKVDFYDIKETLRRLLH